MPLDVERKPTTLQIEIPRPLSLSDLDLGDLESVRLLLRGDSVVDWHRLAFYDHTSVDRILRVHELDPYSPECQTVLERLRRQAVDYLIRCFEFPIPRQVADGFPARDLFILASGDGEFQKWSCVVLKVMHIILHLQGGETLRALPISDGSIFRAAELKVMRVVEELRASGCPIAEFSWSRKTPDSHVTKLLSKRSTLAATIYDRLRFRLLVPTHADLLPVIAVLTRQLIPFNYTVPGESQNTLIALKAETQKHPSTAALYTQLQPLSDSKEPLTKNEFSSLQYRTINFAADLPISVQSILPKGTTMSPESSPMVFVQTEFQIADKATVAANESGDSSHAEYKKRQRVRVRARLLTQRSEK